jgi:MFS family permease
VLAIALALGLVTSAHSPFRLALLPRLAGREALPSAIGYSAMVFNSGRILGPALGAWLLARHDPRIAWLCAAGMYAMAVSIVLTLQGVVAAPRDTRSGFLSDLREGLLHAHRSHGLRFILGFALLNSLLGRTVLELLPALSGQLLAGDAATLALLTGLAGAGSILAGLLMSRQRSDEQALMRLLLIGLITCALSVLPAPWLSQRWTLGGAILLLSLCATVMGTATQALVQLVVQDRLRGRIMSLWSMLTIGGPSLGALCWGWLADRIGFGSVLPLMAVGTLGAATLLLRYRASVTDGTA